MIRISPTEMNISSSRMGGIPFDHLKTNYIQMNWQLKISNRDYINFAVQTSKND